MDKLKPCPFCGGEAKVGSNRKECFILCAKCDARPFAFEDSSGGLRFALELWNRRADKPRESDDE